MKFKISVKLHIVNLCANMILLNLTMKIEITVKLRICQLMVKECVLSTGNLLQGGLPRNSVDRLTDCPDMTSAVNGHKASTHPANQQF